jgi:hypothetical protein
MAGGGGGAAPAAAAEAIAFVADPGNSPSHGMAGRRARHWRRSLPPAAHGRQRDPPRLARVWGARVDARARATAWRGPAAAVALVESLTLESLSGVRPTFSSRQAAV